MVSSVMSLNTLRNLYTVVSCQLARNTSQGDRRDVSTTHGELRDEPQHITQSLHGGELSVGAVTAATHGPDDE